MATQIFSAAEMKRLREDPKIAGEEMIRLFALTPADEAFVRSHWESANHNTVQLGLH